MRRYFTELHTASHNPNNEAVINHVKPIVSVVDNEALLHQFDISKFKKVVFSMQPDKSPSLDGLNLTFYRRYWNLLGHDLFNKCIKWVDQGFLVVGKIGSVLSQLTIYYYSQ